MTIPNVNPIYVIGAANSDDPWVLSLDGYPTREAADRALAWQRRGQGQFDPPGYWQVTEYEPSNGFVDAEGRSYLPGRAPYTEAAWADFIERTGLKNTQLAENCK